MHETGLGWREMALKSGDTMRDEEQAQELDGHRMKRCQISKWIKIELKVGDDDQGSEDGEGYG